MGFNSVFKGLKFKSDIKIYIYISTYVQLRVYNNHSQNMSAGSTDEVEDRRLPLRPWRNSGSVTTSDNFWNSTALLQKYLLISFDYSKYIF